MEDCWNSSMGRSVCFVHGLQGSVEVAGSAVNGAMAGSGRRGWEIRVSVCSSSSPSLDWDTNCACMCVCKRSR